MCSISEGVKYQRAMLSLYQGGTSSTFAWVFTGEVRRLCSFYHEPLRTSIKTNGYKSAFSGHTALKLGEHPLKSYLKIT